MLSLHGVEDDGEHKPHGVHHISFSPVQAVITAYLALCVDAWALVFRGLNSEELHRVATSCVGLLCTVREVVATESHARAQLEYMCSVCTPPGAYMTCIASKLDMLAAGCSDGRVVLWNVPACCDQSEMRQLIGHSASVSALVWSADGTKLISASGDSTCIVWDPFDAHATQVLQGHQARVRCIGYDETAGLVVSGSWDEHVLVWGVDSGKQLHDCTAHSGE